MAAFGFSVGDFFSATTLILQATKALRESDAARTECQEAAAFLDGVERTIRRVISVMSPDGYPDAYQDIIPYAEACRQQVVKSLERFKKYENRLADLTDLPRPGWQKVEKMLVKNKMKLKWVFASKEDLVQIRAAVAPQLELLQLSLQFAEMRKTIAIAERQDSLLAVAHSIHTRLDIFIAGSEPDVIGGAKRHRIPKQHSGNRQEPRRVYANNDRFTAFSGTRRFVAPSVKAEVTTDQVISVIVLYVWQSFSRLVLAMTSLPMKPTLLLDTNIRVKDALGRSLSLPYEHFRHWPVLMARLEIAFEDYPGRGKIQQSDFALFVASGRGMEASSVRLDETNWDGRVNGSINVRDAALRVSRTVKPDG
ncbi:hypothetical protein LTR15_010552 [Elasticomyces elasticus]|nr:hypothetical protein LTR15_010552 [Elasticomyces elasticus]